MAGSEEILHLNFYPGDFRPGYQEFLIDYEDALPPKWVLKGVRSDSNFPSRDGFRFMQERQLQYACKMRKWKKLQRT